jgi:exopolysaccharide biosynthesis protein
MKIRIGALFFALFLTSCISVPRAIMPPAAGVLSKNIASLQTPWQPLASGLSGLHIKIETPRLEAWALRIELLTPNLKIIMNNAESGKNVLKSIKVSSFLREYGCLAVINAGPFAPSSDKEGEERRLTGVFVSNGTLVSMPAERFGAFVVCKNSGAAIVSQASMESLDNILWAVGGFDIILKDGKLLAPAKKTARHPRSAIGLGSDGKTLFLLVIDGRSVLSTGATETETAEFLLKLGAKNALNLDGGGSTALALKTELGPALLNRPAHGIFHGERAVASCIGIVIN